MVNGNVEEALNLCSMKVHGQHTVGTGNCYHIGNQLGRNGIAGLGLAVLTGIAVVGHYGGDAAGRSALEGVDHDEHFHQVIVNRLAGGLYNKNIGATNRFFDGNRNFTIGEGLYSALSQRQTQTFGNGLCQFGVCVGRKDLNVLSVQIHKKFNIPS